MRLLYKKLLRGGSRQNHCKCKQPQHYFAAISGFNLDYRGCGAVLGLHRATTQTRSEGWIQLQGTSRVRVLPGLVRHWRSPPSNCNFGLCCLCCT